MKAFIPPLSLLLAMTATFPAIGADQIYSANGGTQWDTTTANWTGATWVNGNNAIFGTGTVGTVTVAPSTAINFANISFTSGYTIALGAGATLTGAIGASAIDVATGITGTLPIIGNNAGGVTQLVKTGQGTLVLATLGSYTGGTVIKAGTLAVSGGTGGVTNNPITIGDTTGSENATLNLLAGSNFAAAPITVAGGNTGVATLNFGPANYFVTGATTLNNHDFTVSRSAGNSALVNNTLSGTGNLTIANNSSTVNTGNLEFRGTINNTGTISVTSNANSTITYLSGNFGANVTSVTSSINANSSLAFRNANANFVGTIAINSGKMTIGNPATANEAFAIGVGSGFSLNGGNLVLTLNGTGAGQFDTLTGKAGSTFNLASGTITFDGTAIAPGTYQIFNGFTSGTVAPSLTYSGLPADYSASISSTGLLTVVPEPGTWALLGVGLGGVGFIARRRNRASR